MIIEIDAFDLLGQHFEVRILRDHDIFDGPVGIAGVRDDVLDDLRLRKAFLACVDRRFFDRDVDVRTSVLGIEDRIVPFVSDRSCVSAEDQVRDPVESAAPDAMNVLRPRQGLDASKHLSGGAVRERREEDPVRRNSLFE